MQQHRRQQRSRHAFITAATLCCHGMIICVLRQRQVQQSELNPSGWWLERSWKKHNNKQQSRKYISVPQLHVKKFKYTATGNHKSIPISSINRLKMSFYFFSASVVFCSYICTTQSWIFLWVLYLFSSTYTFTALPCFKLKYRLSQCSWNKLLMSVNSVQTSADTEIKKRDHTPNKMLI